MLSCPTSPWHCPPETLSKVAGGHISVLVITQSLQRDMSPMKSGHLFCWLLDGRAQHLAWYVVPRQAGATITM